MVVSWPRPPIQEVPPLPHDVGTPAFCSHMRCCPGGALAVGGGGQTSILSPLGFQLRLWALPRDAAQAALSVPLGHTSPGRPRCHDQRLLGLDVHRGICSWWRGACHLIRTLWLSHQVLAAHQVIR